MIGFVDEFTLTTVSGWVLEPLSRRPIFAMLDGALLPLEVSTFERADVQASGVHGVGFRAAIELCSPALASICVIDDEGARRLLPFSATQSVETVVPIADIAAEPTAEPVPEPQNEAEPTPDAVVGFVDFASSTTLSGWLISAHTGQPFFVEVDGETQPVQMRYFARPDLIEQNIDAVAFQAHFEAHRTSFSLSLGFTTPDGRRVRLPSSETGSTAFDISDFDPSHVVMTSADVAMFAGAVQADTELYLTLVQKFGRALMRSSVTFDVVFIDGSLWSVSTRYRILNVADGLHALGRSTLYVRLDRSDPNLVASLDARVVVFFRAPLDETYERLMQAFRAKGTRVVFDVDDLVFDESLVSDIDGVRYLTHEQMEGYLWGVRSYRRFALTADLVTTSTPFLAEYAARTLGCKTAVIRNTIGKNYLATYPEEASPVVRGGSDFVIGYYSGSKTHQQDFQQAYPALVRFLRTYVDAVLRVVGALDLEEFPDLVPLAGRIRTVGMMSYHEMVDDLGQCDVIIAPLVPGDPFCEAKSELKWFEAALRGRPCIASATETYAAAMMRGRYGYTARDEEEWFAALSDLYLSPSRRADLAIKARGYARRAYSYQVAGMEAQQAYFGVNPPPPASAIQGRAVAASGGKLRVGVVMPDIVVGGGGHRKILKFCEAFALAGWAVTLYVDSKDNPEKVRKTIRTHFYDFPCAIRIFRGSVEPQSLVVCTHWSTAYSLRNHPEPRKVLYFVQDFEPMFDPVSSAYMRAMSTYTLGFNVVCYGHWVAERLRREFGIQPSVVPFSVDREIYRPDPAATRSTDVLFFARPSQPRRCFELGVEALRSIFKSNPATRIGLYGEDQYGDLGFAYHNFGLITDLPKLNKIYTRSRVGLCFSTTNPSLVGYEMLASGLPLVDLEVPGHEVNFGGGAFVYYSRATPESISTQLASALNDEAERVRRGHAGLRYIDALPPEDGFGQAVLDAALEIVDSA